MSSLWLSEVLLFGVGILIPNIVGFLGGLPVKGAVRSDWYRALKQPPFAPPRWAFPIVWPLMYTTMGIASVLIFKTSDNLDNPYRINPTNKIPLTLYAAQLVLNGLWPLIYFKYHMKLLALFELIILDVLIVMTCNSFREVNWYAWILMLPYLAWSLFATLLNYSVWLLNYDNPNTNIANATVHTHAN